IRRERDSRAIRTPRRIAIVIAIVCQPHQAAGCNVEGVEIAVTAPVDGRKDERGSIGTPVRRIDGHQILEAIGSAKRIALEIVDVNDVGLAALGDEGQLAVSRDAHPALEQVKSLELIRPFTSNQDFRYPLRTIE